MIACLIVSVPAPSWTARAQPAEVDAATETAAGVTDEAEAKGQVLIESLQSLNVEYERIEALARDASGQLAELMELRLAEKRNLFVKQVNELAEWVIEREQTGFEVGEERRMITDWLNRLAPGIEERIAHVNELARKTYEKTPDTLRESMKRAIDVDRYIGEIVDWYGKLMDVANTQDQLGLDSTRARNYLQTKLPEAAEFLAVWINSITRDIREIRFQLSLSPDDQDLQTELRIADMQRDRIAENLAGVTDIMKELDQQTEDYESLVVQVTGDVSTDILQTGVLRSLVARWSETVIDWTAKNGPNLIVKFFFFLLILLAAGALSRLTRKVLEKAMSSLSMSLLLRNMMISILANIVFILGALVALSQIGVSPGPLLAGLGIAGFIIGFALQDTLGNFAAGMMILVYRPFDVGDVIEAGGVYGTVHHMSLVSTIVLTFDNQKLVIPNSKIWGDVIRNVTAQTTRRVDLTIGISLQEDIAKAERVLAEVVAANDKVLDEPAPLIKAHKIGDWSVEFIVRPWVRTPDYWDAYWDLTRAIKVGFDEAGISIPVPQRDLRMLTADPDPAPQPARPAGREA